MDVITLSRTLKHYKRPEVQERIAFASTDKEAVGSYGGKGYSKRPDVIVYPADVFELVRNGITSFHISEETWSNPLNVRTGMKPSELDELRIGWDLVLDIDCPFWEFAKIVTFLFVRALEDHGLKSISVKFSGNKGFHIGVPFEAFPEKINETPTKNLFPDGPRYIAQYLLKYISDKLIKVDGNVIDFAGFQYEFEQIQFITKKKPDELLYSFCQSCHQPVKQESKKQFHFDCPVCGSTYSTTEDIPFKKCPKCNVPMEKSELNLSSKCCPNPDIVQTFNPLSIVEVDTVLIAPRHLYRAPYSYHEKSGLVSVPIPKEHIMDFDKKEAEPKNVSFDTPFLERASASASEGRSLLLTALDFHAKQEQRKQEKEQAIRYSKDFSKDFDEVQTAIPEKFFPPCIQLILRGLPDGKKRALFVLINFLSSCGWDYEQMTDFLKQWNKRNPEPVREVYLLGQIRYAKQHKKKVLPPNCDNKGYYKDFHVCKPDNLCRYIKNPANYAIKKAKFAQKNEFQRSKSSKKAGSGKGKPEDKDKDSHSEPEKILPEAQKADTNTQTVQEKPPE